jgi:hypothetical protein
MNKKLAHTIIFLFDLLCLVVVWIGYNEFQRILSEVKTQAEVIQFGNRKELFYTKTMDICNGQQKRTQN